MNCWFAIYNEQEFLNTEKYFTTLSLARLAETLFLKVEALTSQLVSQQNFLH